MAKDINVRIGAKEEVSQASDKAVKAIRNIGTQSTKVGKSLLATWSQATIVVAGVIKAWQAVNRVMQTGQDEYRTRLEAEQRLTNAVNATGAALGLQTAALLAHSDAMSRVTAFGDELIDSAQSILATFGKLSADEMPRATDATLDLAAALGMELDSAAKKVGIALADPERASRRLREMNVILSRSQEDVIKSFVTAGDEASAVGVILSQLETQFGGFAEAVGQSSIGVAERFENLKGDILEQVGEITTALKTNLINSIQPFLEDLLAWITDNAPAIYAWITKMPDVAKIAFETIGQILKRTFQWETLKSVIERLIEGLVGAFKIGINLIFSLWKNLFETVRVAAETMGNDWWKYLINGVTRQITTGGRVGQLLTKAIGLDWEGVEVFDVTGDIGQVMADSFRETSGDFLTSLRTALGDHNENLKSTFRDVASNYDDILTDGADRINAAIEEGKAEFKAFQAREIAAGATGAAGAGAGLEIADTAFQALIDPNASAAARQTALDQARRLAEIAMYGSEYVALQEQMVEYSSAYVALTQAGLTQEASVIKEQFQAVFGELQEILADPDGEKRRRQEALDQARSLAEIARYGEEYMQLQNERAGVLAALQILVDEGFRKETDALTARLAEIDTTMSELLGDGSGAGELVNQTIPSLEDAMGGLDGVVSAIASGIGGYAGDLISAFAAFGWVGLAAVALQVALEGLFNVIGPAINTIIQPVVNFLQMLGVILGTVLLPVFNAFSPILTLVVQILYSIITPFAGLFNVVVTVMTVMAHVLTPILTGLAIAIEVLMSPVKFLGDLFTWIADKIRFSVVQFAAWLNHPFDADKRKAYVASQGAADPGKFSSDAFSGLAQRIRDIIALSGSAPTVGGIPSLTDLLDDFTGLTEWSGPGAENGTGVYGGSVNVTQPPDIYISVHIGEGGVTVMSDRELLQVGEVVVKAVEEVLGTGGKVSWLPAGA